MSSVLWAISNFPNSAYQWNLTHPTRDANCIIWHEVRNDLYEVFQDPDFNDLCKIWQALYSDGQ